MKKNRSAFSVIFTLIMLICVMFVIWYIPASRTRLFQLQDIRKSLETSQGRERKQQREYDEVIAAIPSVQAELDKILPLSEDAKKHVADLKEERKKLREGKKELEAQLHLFVSEEDSHE